MAGKVEQPRMEAYDIANALEYGGFQIVVEQRACDTAKCIKSGDVTTQKALERLIEDETGKDGT